MRKSLYLLLLISVYHVSGQELDLSSFQYREVGPYRGGRSTAVTGVDLQPNVFYFGASGGGLWKTDDYGLTWNNVSDGYFKSPSIGAIRVANNDPNIIYVGTGSDGLRSNVISGKGVKEEEMKAGKGDLGQKEWCKEGCDVEGGKRE